MKKTRQINRGCHNQRKRSDKEYRIYKHKPAEFYLHITVNACSRSVVEVDLRNVCDSDCMFRQIINCPFQQMRHFWYPVLVRLANHLTYLHAEVMSGLDINYIIIDLSGVTLTLWFTLGPYSTFTSKIIIIIIDNFCVALFSGVPKLTALYILQHFLSFTNITHIIMTTNNV